MLQSLVSGISGLRTHQQRMDIIANDIANVNTVAYKQNEVSFKEALVDTIRMPAVGSPGIQVGMGTSLSGITKDFSYGMLTNTGMASNLALQGEGFFVVGNTTGVPPVLDGAPNFTRAGDFVLDVKSASIVNLINSEGMALFGTTDVGGVLTAGPINLQPTAAGAGDLATYSISTDGTVTVVDTNGTIHTVGNVRVVTFQNNNGLNAQGSSLYTWSDAASATAPVLAAANGSDVGLIQQGYLESSNTELAAEFTDMIITQRGFQANSKIITTSDEILQELLMLKR